MPAIEPLHRLMTATGVFITKEESLLLEGELFVRVCDELGIIFKHHFKDFFRSIRFSSMMESTMININFAQLIIRDILASGDYTLNGLAQYADTPEDVLHEIIDGRNTNPTAALLRRLIEIHREVRRELYQAITNKIAMQYIANQRAQEESSDTGN